MMTSRNFKYRTMKLQATVIVIALVAFGCTREERDLPEATFPNTPDVFTDVPVSLTDEFFISFDPAEGANTSGFGVDETIFYEGTASIRIDVPAADDPNGGFIGGIFKDRGDGRNLTEYNAFTFWAKATTTATIGVLGFGNDFEDNEFVATRTDVQFTTGWRQYIIPIPDPSKLVQEKGMFVFSAGSQSTDGLGYTFWLDEMKFENLSSIAQRESRALDLQVVYNVDGTDIAVNAAPAYFDASEFDFAPTPPERNAADVVSIFSDAYTNVQVDNYNGFFQFATTQGGAIDIAGENLIRYSQLNFVSINMFNSPDVDASEMTHIHLDINIREAVNPGDFVRLQIINSDGAGATSGDVQLASYMTLTDNQWIQFDIPLADFTGLGTTDDVDLIFFISDGTISDLFVDNVYFYRN